MRTSGPTSGFTLIEMMVAVAILGIMTALAVGGLEPAVQRLRVASAAEQVQDLLELARADARATGRCTRVDLVAPAPPAADSAQPQLAAGSWGTVLRVWRWNALDCAGAADTTHAQMIAELPLPSGTRASLSAAEQEFLGNGRPQPPLVDFTLDRTGTSVTPSSQTVRLSPAGRSCVFDTSALASCT